MRHCLTRANGLSGEFSDGCKLGCRVHACLSGPSYHVRNLCPGFQGRTGSISPYLCSLKAASVACLLPPELASLTEPHGCLWSASLGLFARNSSLKIYFNKAWCSKLCCVFLCSLHTYVELCCFLLFCGSKSTLLFL